MLILLKVRQAVHFAHTLIVEVMHMPFRSLREPDSVSLTRIYFMLNKELTKGHVEMVNTGCLTFFGRGPLPGFIHYFFLRGIYHLFQNKNATGIPLRGENGCKAQCLLSAGYSGNVLAQLFLVAMGADPKREHVIEKDSGKRRDMFHLIRDSVDIDESSAEERDEFLRAHREVVKAIVGQDPAGRKACLSQIGFVKRVLHKIDGGFDKHHFDWRKGLEHASLDVRLLTLYVLSQNQFSDSPQELISCLLGLIQSDRAECMTALAADVLADILFSNFKKESFLYCTPDFFRESFKELSPDLKETIKGVLLEAVKEHRHWRIREVLLQSVVPELIKENSAIAPLIFKIVTDTKEQVMLVRLAIDCIRPLYDDPLYISMDQQVFFMKMFVIASSLHGLCGTWFLRFFDRASGETRDAFFDAALLMSDAERLVIVRTFKDVKNPPELLLTVGFSQFMEAELRSSLEEHLIEALTLLALFRHQKKAGEKIEVPANVYHAVKSISQDKKQIPRLYLSGQNVLKLLSKPPSPVTGMILNWMTNAAAFCAPKKEYQALPEVPALLVQNGGQHKIKTA